MKAEETLIDGLKQAARQARALHRGHVDFAELQAEVALEVELMPRHIAAVAAPERRIAILPTPNSIPRTSYAPSLASATSRHRCSWACCTPPPASAPSGTSAAAAACSPAVLIRAAPSRRGRRSPSPAAAASSAP